MTKMLCILDGFGLAPSDKNNPVSRAKIPNLKKMLNDYPWMTLKADGDAVGQERGLVGNSEVGHMNIGGLKLVPQLSHQITQSSKKAFDLDSSIAPDQNFDPKEFLKESFKKNPDSKRVHLVGLFSTGAIHSDLRHWAGAIEAAGKAGATQIVLHLISDGRDSDRQSLVDTWKKFTKDFADGIDKYDDKVVLGSVGGRFYAMDRDKNWDRTLRGVYSMFSAQNLKFLEFFKHKYEVDLSQILDITTDSETDFENGLKYSPSEYEHPSIEIQRFLEQISTHSYQKQKFDEDILPINTGFQLGIQKHETVWLINFRSDRMKQPITALCDLNEKFELGLKILANNDYGIKKELSLDLEFIKGYYPIFKTQPVQNTLAEKISKSNATQLHIAETEKYAHVTYFFDGGVENRQRGEDWVIIPSNKVSSHAEKPAMKAVEITDYILEHGLGKYDYIVVNYANPDMLGHTGDISASIKSLEILDEQLGRLLKCVEENQLKIILTSDHGNVEKVGSYLEDGKNLLDTEHNSSPVPCVLVDPKFKSEEFEQRIIDLSSDLSIDLKNVNSALKNINKHKIFIDLDWMQAEEIPNPILPLWYVGVFLLAV
jgi:2,3-bisphosphoglycerate-independent phosphoglycerate mutase